MNEKDFELLSILSKTKNITKTAEILFLTQPAVSKRIQELENDLGTALLFRSRKGVRFTPEGEVVLQYCEKTASILAQLRDKLKRMQGEVAGTLNVGVATSYALYELPDVLMLYSKRYPLVDLNIVSGHSWSIYRQMEQGALDIAVVRGEYPWNEGKLHLSTEKICFICSGENEGRPLNDYTYISYKTGSEQTAKNLRWIRENNAQTRTPRNIHTDSIAGCVELVSRGIGWSLIPEVGLKNFTGHIRPCVFRDGEKFLRNTYALYQHDALDLPQVGAFLRLLEGE